MSVTLLELSRLASDAGCEVDVSDIEIDRIVVKTSVGEAVIQTLGEHLFCLSGCASIVFNQVSNPWTDTSGVRHINLKSGTTCVGSIVVGGGEHG